jgi:hypothetical protein
MAIAFFYAIGTAAGGISGPVLFGALIASGKRGELAVGYVIGAILMIAAGLVEVWLGVNAEQKPLEDIATPLTAEDAGQHQPAADGAAPPTAATGQRRQRRRVEPALTPQATYRQWSPMHPPYTAPLTDTARDREISEIVATLAGAGPIERRQLARLVHADLWGPGRFSPALHKAVAQGKVRRTGRGCTRSHPARQVPKTPRRPLTRPSTATKPENGPRARNDSRPATHAPDPASRPAPFTKHRQAEPEADR